MFKHIPWGTQSGDESQEKHNEDGGESLTTVLDADQRGELTILVASATAAMRRTIEINFDASVSCFSSPEYYCLSDPPRQRSLLSLTAVCLKKKRSRMPTLIPDPSMLINTIVSGSSESKGRKNSAHPK